MKAIQIAILIASVTLFQSCKLADIRTDEVIAKSPDKDGKQLIEQMNESHGSAHWDSIETYSIQMTDEFYGVGKLVNPFPKNVGQMDMSFIPGSFSSRATFMDNKWNGKVWGIQSWKTFGGTTSSLEFHKKNDKNVEFWLPTYQYLIELPKRIAEGTIIQYGGSRTIGDHSFDLVFVSWNDQKPQKDIDQYVLWIDSKTHLLNFVQYTVRDQGGFVNATLEYADYHTADGLKVPATMNVRLKDDMEGKIMHTMKLSNIQIDAVSKEAVQLDPTMGTKGKQ